MNLDRILADAGRLSFPRYPGTPGDRRAIALVRHELESADLEVMEEAFSYDLRPVWRILRLLLVGCGVLLAAAGWLVHGRIQLAFLLVLCALVAGGSLLIWAPWLERLYAREGSTATANVVGRRPASDPRLTLVLMAHHDSKSQNLTLAWRLGLTIAALVGGALLVVMVLPWTGGLLRNLIWLAPACGSMAAIALFGLSCLKSGNDSPGAVDNAGSLAILLELARNLPSRCPKDVELVFLSTGAEEDHMVGAMRWLERHHPELLERPVLTLNLDGAGNPGRVVLLDRYGIGRRFSKALSRVARETAQRLEFPVRGVLLPPGVGIDSIPFAHRGLESITLSSGSLGHATLAVHSARDRPENLDRDALHRVARLALGVASELASASSSALAQRSSSKPSQSLSTPSSTSAAPG